MKNKDGCSFCYPALPENLFSLDFSEEENCWYILLFFVYLFESEEVERRVLKNLSEK